MIQTIIINQIFQFFFNYLTKKFDYVRVREGELNGTFGDDSVDMAAVFVLAL